MNTKENYRKQIHRRPTAELGTLDRVRQVRPVALEILLEGLDLQADWMFKIPCEPLCLPTEEETDHLYQWSESCLTTGIAIGLLLRPEAVEWTPGGDR